jgi:hypothetical protein
MSKYFGDCWNQFGEPDHIYKPKRSRRKQVVPDVAPMRPYNTRQVADILGVNIITVREILASGQELNGVNLRDYSFKLREKGHWRIQSIALQKICGHVV